MNYYLEYMPKALKRWNKLDLSVKKQFYKKLQERLNNPKVLKDKLSGYENIYKIKLRSSGFRLVYEVKDEEIIVLVLTLGKRENNKVYDSIRDK